MKLVSLFFFAMMISGCSSYTMIRKADFQIPDSTMRECKDLEEASDTKDTVLLNHSKHIISRYIDCRSANEEKMKILKNLQSALN